MITAPLTQAPRRVHRRTGESTGTNWTRLLDYRIRVNDRSAYERLQQNVFRRGIYHFESRCRDPLIVDFGCGIGVSILYFKHVYPAARIVAFEPDPATLPYLTDNLERNGLTDVALVEPCAPTKSGGVADGTAMLADCLTEPVEFMKMTQGGAEWDMLAACGDRLRQVRSMVIEYHHRPSAPRTLHRILGRLDELGFDYLISALDGRDNPDVQPPIRLTAATRYDLLIHAGQREMVTPA